MLYYPSFTLVSDVTRASEPMAQQAHQGQGPPNIYDFQSHARSIRPGHNASEDTPRILYQKVPGWGGQTKLLFNPS